MLDEIKVLNLNYLEGKKLIRVKVLNVVAKIRRTRIVNHSNNLNPINIIHMYE
jgi:hypothetical protein